MSASTEPLLDYANTVAYINGRIYTINDSSPWAEAFIVSENGYFSHVGSNHKIQQLASQHHIVTVDLKNQFVMPGVHDAHMHLLFSGLCLTSGAVIGMDATHLDIASKIQQGSCACEYINVYQDWILAAAYNNECFPNGVADRKYLDALFPDRPVVVQGGAAYSMLLNTEALKRAGYDIENEPDTHAAKLSPAHVERTLKHAIGLAHKAGVTSTQEASSNTQLLTALSELEKEGDLKLDVSTHVVYGCAWLASESKDSLNQLLDAVDHFKSKHVDTRFVKIVLDGVPLPPLLTHAGLGEHGHVDQSKIVTEDVADAVLKFDQLGCTVKIHCTGHGSTRLAFDAIEAARKVNPTGPRHEIAHNSGVHDDGYKRYAPFNVTAEISPAELFTHPITLASNALMDWNFPRMLASGAHITIGSDWGAVPDPSLFSAMASIVSTVGNGDKAKGGEMLCRMFTLNGAIAVGKEKDQGKC
ncbi:amidohydrolase-like protein 3 [Setomelanomma holmii]|uniref:Amidohydrolase-like protein 3 n=1 Tax=Setomelanomma holmii TaxID=210430 RepID=A0A9P4HHI2_9PLEO|nr:amidohydrolase-like protein 3 [Setomelanomma holmii]